MLNVRVLPLVLAIGLSVLTASCQSDDSNSDDSIVPDTTQPPPAAGNRNADDATIGDPPETEADDDDPEASDSDSEADDEEDADEDDEDKEDDDDEFEDGNYGKVDGDNTYRPRNNQFEVTLPDRYDIQPQRDGVAFVSSDGGFGGEVVFFKDDKPLDADELEDALKKIYNELLDGASWQLSEIQPDGSVRLDWRGTTPEGQELDAISYIEQRNDTVFILNVYGIDRPYDAFLDDSQTIIGSYLTWPDSELDIDESDESDESDDAGAATLDDDALADDASEASEASEASDDAAENRVAAP